MFGMNIPFVYWQAKDGYASQRVALKGKSKKQALVAVSNKLVKQAYAIAKSGLVYDENFRSRQPQIKKKTKNICFLP